MLNSLKISIFQTCFADAMEDVFGYPLISSPPITSFLIALSVYVIIVNSTIFPQSFREPKPIFMCLYEVSAPLNILFDYFFVCISILLSALFLSLSLFLITVFSNRVFPGICNRVYMDANRRTHLKHTAEENLSRNVTIYQYIFILI